MKIVVMRGAGDRPGIDPITDQLLATIPALRARGEKELDDRAHHKQTVTLQIVYRGGVELGQLVEVYDVLQGVTWRGKITGITHEIANVEEPSVFTTLVISKPVDIDS